MEGEYLELVNDLRDQYIAMKAELSAEIEYYKRENDALKSGEKMSNFSYICDQFNSPRPLARKALYVHYAEAINIRACQCGSYHPFNAVCYRSL
jgi:hypothetical protein